MMRSLATCSMLLLLYKGPIFLATPGQINFNLNIRGCIKACRSTFLCAIFIFIKYFVSSQRHSFSCAGFVHMVRGAYSSIEQTFGVHSFSIGTSSSFTPMHMMSVVPSKANLSVSGSHIDYCIHRMNIRVVSETVIVVEVLRLHRIDYAYIHLDH